MIIPLSFSLGPHQWTLSFDEVQVDDGHCGSTYTLKQIVRIGKDMKRPKQEVTLLHELLHIAADFSGISDDEEMTLEQFIARIDNPLHMLLEETQKHKKFCKCTCNE